ncbi:MAG: hypothetical protein ACI9VR_002709 [Cognaticolwellia sp.]|jgi:hypothetical protein
MSITLLSVLSLLGCGRDITESDVKFAGVGLNPDEIGPVPEYFGGLVELDLLNFSSGGLSLGAVGFGSYEEIGVDPLGFQPPYELVYGLAFVFDDLVPAPHVLHGTIGVGPSTANGDACWTNFEPFSPLMASTVELGSELRFETQDGETEFIFGRIPEIYPPNPQDIFVYYSQVEPYRPIPLLHYALQDDGSYQDEIVQQSNWKPGASFTMKFGGGMPPIEAPVSSIPVPSGSQAPQSIVLPNKPAGLSLSWDGVARSAAGDALEGEVWTTCAQFWGRPTTDGQDPQDCTQFLEPEEVGGLRSTQEVDRRGQMYTGPWDTESGELAFNWQVPDAVESERVTLNVRFLGPLDRDEERFLVSVVDDTQGGTRSPLECDSRRDVEYIFDESLLDPDGNLPVTLQGNPNSNLAEVSCALVDDGEFILTQAHLESALRYANAKGAEGAVFYFSRGTELDATFPDVRDQAGFRREISPVKIVANSVTIGRLWVDGTETLRPEGN